eukprot:3506310-Rhodomonas_salina.4
MGGLRGSVRTGQQVDVVQRQWSLGVESGEPGEAGNLPDGLVEFEIRRRGALEDGFACSQPPRRVLTPCRRQPTIPGVSAGEHPPSPGMIPIALLPKPSAQQLSWLPRSAAPRTHPIQPLPQHRTLSHHARQALLSLVPDVIASDIHVC